MRPLVAQDDEIRTFFLAGQHEADIAGGNQAFYLFALQGLQPCAQANDNTGLDRIACLCEQVVRRFGRVSDGEPFKHCGELRQRRMGQKLVSSRQRLLCISGRLVYIKNQSAQEVLLAVVPKWVSVSVPGVCDDDIR